MKNIAKLIVLTAVMASVPAARAAQMDFDGAAGRTVSFSAELSASDVPQAAAPESKAADTAGEVLSVAVERNATSKKTFSADGSQAGIPSVKFLIKVKSPASESEWAMGADDKVYSLGTARQAPEFAAVRKLADALALTGNPGRTRGKKCETDKEYVCINGQTNECKVDKCGWCGKWEDGTWGCEWSTISAPYACSPNGYRC